MSDSSSFNIDFNFMVFQGNPKTDSIYFWIDGGRDKHKMMRNVFLKLVTDTNNDLSHIAYTACNTYSFYIWNKQGNSIVHLTPKGTNEDPYQDSIYNVIQGRVEPRHLALQNLEETLSSYGFNVPSEGSVGNLKTAIGPTSASTTGDKFSMIRQLLSGRRK